MGFAFAAALFALPLAAVPILLHMLHRQRSPVVMFSTLRFVRLSVRQTAARRRVQKWLLLACRTLLLLLLIWAVAQPVRHLASAWGAGSPSSIAAVVVDTSYSMQLQDGPTTLLNRADEAVQDLLHGPLARAQVAVFTSAASTTGSGESLRDASARLTEWTPLQPQAAARPLVDRVADAVALLDRQPAGNKVLLVVSDFQGREFPHAMPQPKDGRTVLLDVHPAAGVAAARSAGVTRVSLDPAQPIPGLPVEAAVEVTGPAGDARPIVLRTSDLDGKAIAQTAPLVVTPDASGRGTVRFPLTLPAQRWVTLTAELTSDDAMPWDNARSQLVEVPPKQRVTVLQQTPASPAERFVRLALDPSEGQLAEWPLAVSTAAVPGASDAAFVVLTRWPDARRAALLRDFATAGHTLMLFLSPGLEQQWPALPRATQDALLAVLPSAPINRPAPAVSRAAVANLSDPLLVGLTDEKVQWNGIVVRGLVPLAAEANASPVLNAVPIDPVPGSRTQGLLFRKPVGRAGVCFTFATVPESALSNLATHPTFLPMLVRMALKPPERSLAQNVELGHPLTLDAAALVGVDTVQIESPNHESYRIPATTPAGVRTFAFNGATTPGLYTWRRATDDATPLAVANVQLPAAESDLSVRPAASVCPAGPDVIVASSVPDLSRKIDQLTAPQPQWSLPLAVVMFLLCLEALMGSWSKLWKPPPLRAFLPGFARREAAASV